MYAPAIAGVDLEVADGKKTADGNTSNSGPDQIVAEALNKPVAVIALNDESEKKPLPKFNRQSEADRMTPIAMAVMRATNAVLSRIKARSTVDDRIALNEMRRGFLENDVERINNRLNDIEKNNQEMKQKIDFLVHQLFGGNAGVLNEVILNSAAFVVPNCPAPFSGLEQIQPTDASFAGTSGGTSERTQKNDEKEESDSEEEAESNDDEGESSDKEKPAAKKAKTK
ncbi:hypothetical protein L5515_018668 [Caenorhabditis briggsae]|uniref:Uncharacterized protein n=1 Tax=Caenorhabditis briggsae TaxID=6238 RepID=A0AAE9FH44_CAEBR|nr:hypothetical protein L5515_018668 [Caenorhabditis briggsae]